MISLSYLLISILAFQSLSSTSADSAYIQKLCNKTPRPDFCLSVLLSDHRSLGATNPTAATLIAIDLTKSTETAASADIDNHLASKYKGKPEAKPISDCAGIYSKMGKDLQQASGFISDGSHLKATDAILSALARPDACENGFETRNLQSPLAATDMDLKKKTALCMELARLIT